MSSNALIYGLPSETSRNLLFQIAVSWAEECCKVVYLTRKKFQNIPSTVHGPQTPSSEVLAKIRIVYLENLDELMKFIIDILTFRDTVPRVILVEELNEFTTRVDSRDSDHRLARACATLCYVATCCAAHCNSSSHLLLTLALPRDKIVPVVSSMFGAMWSFNSIANTLTRDSVPVKQLVLAHRSDGALVLRDIKSLFF